MSLRSLIALGLAGLLLTPPPPGAAASAAAGLPFLAGFPVTPMAGRVDFVSPTVVDLDGDGQLDVLAADSNGCVYAWNRAGQLLAGFPAASNLPCTDGNAGRIQGPLAVADLTGDGRPEIVAGNRGPDASQPGRVSVWDYHGQRLRQIELAWPGNVTPPGEVPSVVLANVTGDAALEIIAGSTQQTTDPATALNAFVFFANGQLVAGWPAGYRTSGVFSQIAAADLNGDGRAEVIIGRDHPYVHVHTANGSQLPGWPAHTYLAADKMVWQRDPYVEYTNSAPAIGDLDRDGVPEIVIAGKVRDPLAGSSHPVVNNALLVLRADGQRAACWGTARQGGAPLSSNILPNQAPALGDLDGDGRLDIVVATRDGVLRAYTAGGRLRWAYDFAQGRRRFGSEPALGDVDGDGQVDVVFGTYSPDVPEADSTGIGVYALNADGQVLAGYPLSLTRDTGSQRGVRAAPTLADLDGDGSVEILATAFSGALYVWDTGAPYRADRMPWPTGRQNNRRTGEAPAPAQPAAGPAPAPVTGARRLFLPLATNGGCN